MKRSDLVLSQKPLHPRTNPRRNVTNQKRHQNFDYTTIADLLMTVSRSNNNYPTGVVKRVLRAPNFPLTATVV